MKIVIISGTAPPEPLTASRINWDIANHMATGENEVWLISPKPSRPLGTKYPTFPDIHLKTIRTNFIQVYIDSFTCPKYNLFLRAYESLDFGIKSIRYVNRRIGNHDLIFASSWPFFSQLAIVLLRKNKSMPLIMNIQDLYPESFFAKLHSKPLKKIFHPLYFIDRFIAEKSFHITVISETLKEVYVKKRRISESKITIIQNWQDFEPFIHNHFQKEEILKKYDIKGATNKFIYMYLGNIGPVAGVETLINSFAEQKNIKSFLIIAGSGSEKNKCLIVGRKLKLANLVFLDVPSGLNTVAELQSIADVLLLPIKPEASLSSVPSKLITYMLSRKPIISSASLISETAKVIIGSGCGWITKNCNPSEWIELMDLAYKTDKVKLSAMGESGFKYAVAHYSKTTGLNKMSQLINNLHGERIEKMDVVK
jgi:glycosyltransferase involved in cell wall biosynthesis